MVGSGGAIPAPNWRVQPCFQCSDPPGELPAPSSAGVEEGTHALPDGNSVLKRELGAFETQRGEPLYRLPAAVRVACTALLLRNRWHWPSPPVTRAVSAPQHFVHPSPWTADTTTRHLLSATDPHTYLPAVWGLRATGSRGS